MTIFYPDASSFQGNINLPAGNVGICEKSTQGTGYTNPYYGPVKAQAAAKGQFFFAYHFLEQGNGTAQAQHAHSVVGNSVGLMLDWEVTTGSHPTVGDAEAFVTEYRALGGKCNLLYLPNWYWQQLGSPSLSWFAGKGMKLVTSDYTSYSDSGVGWNGYGGMSVAIWQFSDAFAFAGQHVDFNAFKGTVAEWKALVLGQSAPAQPTAKWQEYISGGQLPLAGLADKLNVGPATLLANTANHYGYFDSALGNYIKGLATGSTKPTDKLPKGSRFWAHF